ncbi:hypothetical protein LOTGIDRAFT_175828 [Lottia gigantea]|uniref:Uncharacterized protein n=1 Tax=Lottia gigantea TaxID=225164 RepID=V4A0M4_LOTGI|nr:hypothetical protein LOTGIDRAFT_175828 [Lottia gigantea]ESO90227.1 hypothetical protein LOTGIDRAFT_175828 [Lottia gigantea]
MANKFGLGSLPLESKNPMSSTAFINKAKPSFVDQIGDTLQGDIDMNNFKITNLKFPGNDNDSVNKKYLLDQINAIQIDKDHVENRLNDLKRFIRRNIKNLVDEPKLQQELTSLKRLIQVDKTSQLQNLISKLDDKITKVKIDVQRLIDNPNVNEGRLKRKLTALERKLGELLAELDKTADKTELQNSISNLNEKIAKQKSDVQDIINTLPIDKDTLKRQLTALDTKITDELEKEVGVIKNFLQNKFRDDMKNYIKEQVNLLVSRIHDDFLRQEKKLSKLEAIVTDKSYYFNLPFESGKYTSIDVHKSQQEREFIVHLSFAEGSDSIFEGGGFISRAKINIEKEKRKYSYHLNQDHTKEEMSLVRVNVFTFNTRKYNNARPNKHAIYDIIYGSIYRKFT